LTHGNQNSFYKTVFKPRNQIRGKTQKPGGGEKEKAEHKPKKAEEPEGDYPPSPHPGMKLRMRPGSPNSLRIEESPELWKELSL